MAVTPEQLTVIRNLARCGHTDYYIANALGFTPANFSYHKVKSQDIRDALSISKEDVLLDVKGRLTHIANFGGERNAIAAGQFLLNRYETQDAEEVVDMPSDEAIKREILDELNQ